MRSRTAEFFVAAEAAAARRGGGGSSSSVTPRATAAFPSEAGQSLLGGDALLQGAVGGGGGPSLEHLEAMRRRRPAPRRSAFASEAAAVGRDIAVVSEKLEQLTRLAKKRSLFDDPTVEIQQLSVSINRDIQALNDRLAALEEQKRAATQQSRKEADRHVATVLTSLKGKLKGAAKSFSEVMELRTQSMRTQQRTRQLFTGDGGAAGGGGGGGGAIIGDVPSTPGGAGSSAVAMAPDSPSVAIPIGGGAGAGADSGTLEPGSGMLLATQAIEVQDRGEVVRGIESTIHEIAGMFQQLSSLVAEQGEMIERIDANIEESVANTNTAQNELLRYLSHVSSNRGLVLKLFGILVLFVIAFILLL